MNIKTHWNYDWRATPYTKNNGISMTTPDMTMPIRTLIEKFANGTIMQQSLERKLYFDGEGHDVRIDDDILQGQNWAALDIVEKHQILEQAKNSMNEIKNSIERDKKVFHQHDQLRKQKAEEQKKKFEEFLELQNKTQKA